MRRHTATAAALLASMLLALPARAATLLHLSDTESISVAPDELAASLRAEASSADPAAAQQRVNAAMANALARARQVAGVTVSTGGYAVWHVSPTPQDPTERWQASQTLHLTSHDSGPLLTLVGNLQHAGMTIESLDWQLSPQAQRKAHDEAMRRALTALRGKAEAAASVLGLRFDSFKEVRLGATPPPPMPRFTGMVAMAAAAPPPSAVAADVPVTATAEADAILLTK